jgi:hypothetical protein
MCLSRSLGATCTALTLVSTAIIGGAVTATTTRAQAARPERARLLSLAATGGLGGVPDALGSQCGNVRPSNSSVSLNGGVALLARPWRWFVLQADARVALPMANDCTDLGTPVSYDYPDDLERVPPVGTAAARIGVETPRSLPLVRATTGVGTVWGGRPLPLAVVGVAAGTRGKGARFLVELDHHWTRVDAVEHRFNPDPLGDRLTREVVLRPSWDVLRVGVEVPLTRNR